MNYMSTDEGSARLRAMSFYICQKCGKKVSQDDSYDHRIYLCIDSCNHPTNMNININLCNHYDAYAPIGIAACIS
jgi:hypothetical protein